MKPDHSAPAAPATSDDHTRAKAGPSPVDPWQEFLSARARVVEWLVREYNWSDAQISRQLSLSPGQVQRMRPAGASHGRSGATDTDVTMQAPLDN